MNNQDNIPPELEVKFRRLVAIKKAFGGVGDFLESQEAARRLAEKEADAEFEKLALEIEEREAKRKQIWGSKYPRVLGDLPGTPVHRVKQGKQKGKKKVQ